MNWSARIRSLVLLLKPKRDDFLLPLVRHFEGYYADWYRCSSGVRTIGYGHTGSINGLKAPPWSEEYAAYVLSLDLTDTYEPAAMEACAKRGVDFTSLSVAQQAAIVSAVYNAGPGIVRDGSWFTLFKQGADRKQVEQAFYRWNKSGGKVSPGLVRRRFAEMLLFWEGKLNMNPGGWREYYEVHR